MRAPPSRSTTRVSPCNNDRRLNCIILLLLLLLLLLCRRRSSLCLTRQRKSLEGEVFFVILFYRVHACVACDMSSVLIQKLFFSYYNFTTTALLCRYMSNFFFLSYPYLDSSKYINIVKTKNKSLCGKIYDENHLSNRLNFLFFT